MCFCFFIRDSNPERVSGASADVPVAHSPPQSPQQLCCKDGPRRETLHGHPPSAPQNRIQKDEVLFFIRDSGYEKRRRLF